MARDFGSISAIKTQLQLTEQTIKSFKDEVVGDDIPRYNNVDNHLRQLRKSIDGAKKALVSLEDLNVTALPNFDGLIQTVNVAISAINKKKNLDSSGALVAALAALSGLQASLGEIKTEGPEEDSKRRVDKTDTDTDARE